MISTTERPRGATAPWSPLKAIVVGGLLAGAFDMSYALIWFSGVKGVPRDQDPAVGRERTYRQGLVRRRRRHGLLGIC